MFSLTINMKKRVSVWDILFWIAMIILIVFIIGKLTGLIHSPDWVDLIPLITFVFLIGAFYQKVSNFMEVMYKRTDYLKKEIDNIKNKIN